MDGCKINQNQIAQVEAPPAQVTENVEDLEEKLFVASIVAECSVTTQDHHVWLFDRGCTHHMTANLNIFEWLNKNYFSKFRFGDERLVDAKGKGAVIVQTLLGMKIICDVLFVPEISQSFLSVIQLHYKNYALLFKYKTSDIVDLTSIKLLLVKMNSRSFPLDWKHTNIGSYVSIQDETYVLNKRLGHVSIQDETYVSHQRVGHINFISLKLIKNKDLIADMSSKNETSNGCALCQMGS